MTKTTPTATWIYNFTICSLLVYIGWIFPLMDCYVNIGVKSEEILIVFINKFNCRQKDFCGYLEYSDVDLIWILEVPKPCAKMLKPASPHSAG